MSLFGARKTPEPMGAAPATLRDLVARYPGPAMQLSPDGAVTVASPAAAAYLERDGEGRFGAWWDELSAWLCDSRSPDLPFRTSRIETDRGHVLIEWVVTGLPDGSVLLLGRDVTVERSVRDALAESRQRLRDLVDLACDFGWETGPEGRFVYFSTELVLGHRTESLVGRPVDDLLAEPTIERSPFETRHPVEEAAVVLRGARGRTVEVVLSARPLHDASGAWRGARGICRIRETGQQPDDDAR